MEAIKKCCCNKTDSSAAEKRDKKLNFLNVITGIVFFLFPKCPICWAAYASIFSFLGYEHIAYNATWKYWVLAIFLTGSAFLIYKHYKNKSWWNIIIYTSGIGLLLTIYYLDFNQSIWLYVVAALMLLSNLKLKSILVFKLT